MGLVLALALILWRSSLEDHVGIAVFAAGVLIISISLPHANQRLNGTAVDFIYYTAVIVGVLGFYIAGEQDRERARLDADLAEDRALMQAAETRRAELTTQEQALVARLSRTTQVVEETHIALADEQVQALLAAEPELALTLRFDLGLDGIASVLSAEALSCRQTSEGLARALAFARMDRDRRAEGTGPDTLPDLGLMVEVEALEQEFLRCGRVEGFQAQVDRAEPGFAQLAVLWSLNSGSELWEVLPGRLYPVPDPQGPLARRLDAVLGVNALRTRLSRAERGLEEIRGDLSVTRPDIATTEAEIDTLVTRMADTQSAIDATDGAPLSRLTSRARALMEERWPYLLIALLGMKLARKRLSLTQ